MFGIVLGRWPAVFKGSSSNMFLYATAFAVCLLVLVDAANDVPSGKSLDENLQLVNGYYKRGWKTDLPMWGKRGWSNLHSGWGKRDSNLNAEKEIDNFSAQLMDKRAWQGLQGGWGKRYIPAEDEVAARQLAAALDNDYNDDSVEYFPAPDNEPKHEINKRNWKSFSDGWGKRSSKWENFRGSWGKRQPAWNNLKGLWGKRSTSD